MAAAAVVDAAVNDMDSIIFELLPLKCCYSSRSLCCNYWKLKRCC